MLCPGRARPATLSCVLLLAGVVTSCDDGHRDQNYGTDAGTNYVIPDAGPDGAGASDRADVSTEGGADAGTGG